MSEMFAVFIWSTIGVYTLIGACAALWLVFAGFTRFDPEAAAAPLRIKLLWFPGLIALWPLLLRRASGAVPPEDR